MKGMYVSWDTYIPFEGHMVVPRPGCDDLLYPLLRIV
jgi:hypothetical protein